MFQGSFKEGYFKNVSRHEKCFDGVIRVFQWIFKGILKKLKGGFKKVLKVFQGSFRGVLRVFQGIIMFQKCSKSVSRKFQLLQGNFKLV